MATSSSYNYNETVDGILKEALGLIGVYSPGEALEPEESSDATRTLNFMMKAWQGDYWGLWLKKEYSLYLQDETYSYNIGPTGDHCAISSIKTELAAVGAASATSLTIDSKVRSRRVCEKADKAKTKTTKQHKKKKAICLNLNIN